MKKVYTFSFVLALFFSQGAFANYNANIVGIVTEVILYTHHNGILFKLQNQPTHVQCNHLYFEIDSSVPENRRQLLLDRLLLAYEMQIPINIGYDEQGGCGTFQYIRTYRIG